MKISEKKKKFVKKNFPRMSEAELANRLNIKKKEVTQLIQELNLKKVQGTEEKGGVSWTIFSEDEKKTRFSRTNKIALLLILLTCIFFWKTIFLGRGLSAADALFSYYPWKSVAPEGFLRASNYLLWDEFVGVYNSNIFISESLKNGQIPLWNPYIMCGYPFVAQGQTAFFFPITLLLYFIPPFFFMGIRAILLLFIAGISTYFFLRLLSANRFGSLVSAITFMFSSFIITGLGHPHTIIVVLLPLLFYLTEKLIKKTDLVSASLLALVIGFQYFGGHPPTSFHVLSALGLYFVFRVVWDFSNNRDNKWLIKVILYFSIANVIGLILATVQILPFWELMRESSSFGARSNLHDLSKNSPFGYFSIETIILTLVPNFFGNPVDGNTWEHFLKYRNFYEMCIYIGILPLFLAAIAFIFKRRDNRVLFFSGLAILSLCIIYGAPGVFHLVVNLPGFNLIKNSRIRLLFYFSSSILAGVGANYLAYQMDEIKKRKVLKYIYLPITLVVILSFFLFLFRYQLGLEENLYTTLSKNNITDYIFRYYLLFLLFMGIATAIIALYCKGIMNLKQLQLSVLIFIIIDLFIFTIRWNPTQKKKDFYPVTESINFLKKDPEIYRIAALGKALLPNTSTAYRLFDIRGHDSMNLRRYEEFITGKSGNSLFFFFLNSFPQLADLMNVKYFLLSPDTNLREVPEWLTLVFAGDLKVYRNNQYLPRAFVVHRAEVIKDDKMILGRLYQKDFNPRFSIIVERDILEEQQKLREAPLEDDSSVQIVEYMNNSVTINAKMETPGFLFLSDTFSPGWKAYVNGEEREIFRADYVFRAVFLEEGDYVVEFKYEPESFRRGLYLSSITLVLLLGILVWGGISEKRGKVEDKNGKLKNKEIEQKSSK